MESFEALLHSKLFWSTAILSAIYLYLRYVVYNFWAWKGIPHDEPLIPMGNLPFSYLRGDGTHGTVIRDSYRKYKKHRFHGLYLLYEPILVINDPDLIRQILVKNYPSFFNRGTYFNEKNDPLSCALPRLYDDKWKRLRSKLTPTFTSGKLKQMYPLLEETSMELVRAMDNSLQKSNIVEIKDLSSRFTVDCISTIAFGFNCNSLKEPDQEFYRYGRISNDFGKMFVLLSFYVPSLLKFYPVPETRRKVQKFFIDLFTSMVTYRRKENIQRKDFMSLLMQLMDRGKVQEDESVPGQETNSTIKHEDKLSMTEAMAQAVIFFAAGQETTSSVICNCLYELSFNKDVQEKLREEVDKVFDTPEGLTYESLSSMKYLDLVVCETLRKHPGAPVLNRICTEDFDIPDSNFKIPKGLRMVISTLGIHNDPDIYPEPQKFDPERFTPENKLKRHPFTYIPFGEGPKQCIGKRLGILKPKIAICYLMRHFEFSVCDKTQRHLTPMNNFFVQVPGGDIYLQVERRKISAQ